MKNTLKKFIPTMLLIPSCTTLPNRVRPEKIGTDQIVSESGGLEYAFCSRNGAWKCKTATHKTQVGQVHSEHYGDNKIPVVTIEFGFDSSSIGKGEIKKIDQSLDLLKDKKIAISGYTDSKGPIRYNRKLAIRRSENVKKYLLSKGLRSENIKIVSNPNCCHVSTGDYDQKNKKLRRAEVFL